MVNEDNNIAIAQIFFEIADILQLKNIRWKPQAYIIGGQTIESLKQDVSQIYRIGGIKALEELSGIGQALAKKILEYLQTGKIREFEKLKSTIPLGLYEMMKISGVGAKKASFFYNKLAIKNIDELYRAAEEHKLRGLPGFKERAEEKIIEGINLMKSQKPRMALKEAEKIVNKILPSIKEIRGVMEVIVAGSLRRKKSSIGDLDILIRTDRSEEVLKNFVKLNFVKEILGVGKEKATIITKQGIQIDVRVFTEEEFGAGLLYFTGDKQHNIWLRKIAIKKGLKLNEYGLFNNITGRRIAGKTEREIYSALGLKWILPEKRIGVVKSFFAQ
jgi:DNA polymerase (family 10)